MDVSTATDTGSATTGPATFSDTSLSWSEDSSASTPSPESPPAASASADATEPPAADAPTDGSTPAPGEPPKERWDSILANARQKAAEDALAPYAWAKSVDQREFQQIQQIARHFTSGNVVEGLQNLIAEIRQDPQHDAALRSLHARALAAARGHTTAPGEQEPQPDLPIQLEDGRVVHLYSAEQQAKREAFLQQRWLSQVKQEFQPVTQTIEQLRAREAAALQQQQVDHFVTTTYADVQTWPGMSDTANQKAVAQAMAAMGLPNDASPERVSLALNEAYRKVVLPTLHQKAESQLLDSLKTKAAASTSVNPGTAASSAPRRITSFHDAGLKW